MSEPTMPHGPWSDPQEQVYRPVYKATFVADQVSVRDALANIRAALVNEAFEAAFIGRVETVLAELFNNIAEHAYADTEGGVVTCRISKREASVDVDVTDHGTAMPGGALPDGVLPDLDVAVADLPEGGFGWFIIRSQTDALSYERRGTENCTRLTFEVARPAEA